MTERPIIFSAPMVRAILEGRKTQTRRPIKDTHGDKCPFGVPGDRLWVRETFCPDWCDHVIYRANGGSAREAGYSSEPKWKPSIHMPRLASRITLEITGIRVQRIQHITRKDAVAEGFSETSIDGYWLSPEAHFADVWDSLNAKRGYPWNSNPWVWVIEFRRISPHEGNNAPTA